MTDTLDNEWDFASGVRKAPRSGQRRNGLELLTRENFANALSLPQHRLTVVFLRDKRPEPRRNGG
jgi:hypothetical protein